MTYEEQLLALCKNLRLLRHQHKLSKREMAQILGVGTKNITLLENNIVSPRLGSSVLLRASEYFHTTTNDLLLPISKKDNDCLY